MSDNKTQHFAFHDLLLHEDQVVMQHRLHVKFFRYKFSHNFLRFKINIKHYAGIRRHIRNISRIWTHICIQLLVLPWQHVSPEAPVHVQGKSDLQGEVRNFLDRIDNAVTELRGRGAQQDSVRGDGLSNINAQVLRTIKTVIKILTIQKVTSYSIIIMCLYTCNSLC